MAREVYFAGVPLYDGDPFFINDYDPDGSAKKNTRLVQIAREDGAIRVYDEYEPLTVNLVGWISCDSESALDDAIDTLKALMRTEGTLKVWFGSEYRYLDCLATNVIVSRGTQNISFAPYSIQLESESCFWRGDGYDYHIAGETITTSSDSFNVSIATTMDAELVFTLLINEITPDDSDVTITIGNNDTSEFISVTDTFVDGDTLIIDCKRKQAFLNGALVKARGIFPVWQPGSGVVQYSDTASTSRNITIDSANERRFL